MSLQGRFGCRSMRGSLIGYADGELSTSDRFAFELHVEECEACHDAVGFHLKIEELLHRDAGIEADPEFEDRMVAGVRRRIDAPLTADGESQGEQEDPTHWLEDDSVLSELSEDPSTWADLMDSDPSLHPVVVNDSTSTAPLPQVSPKQHRSLSPAWRWAAAASVLVGGSAWLIRGNVDPAAPAETAIASKTDDSSSLDEPATDIVTPTDRNPPRVSNVPRDTASSSPVPIGPGGDTQIRFNRLQEAQRHVRDALVVACSAPDFRAAFSLEVAELEGGRWPIENLVVGAIDDDDSTAANAAIRGVAELGIQSAMPAIRRAARRSDTAATALITLGTLGDSSMLKTMARNLTSPDLSQAAFTGLSRLGSFEAACAIAAHLSDPDLGPEAADALADLGLTGVVELMRAAESGDSFAREVLRERQLPSSDQVATLLQSDIDDALVTLSIRRASIAGADAVPGLHARLDDKKHRDDALAAMVALVHPTAIAAIADAIDTGTIETADGLSAIRSSLELTLDPGPMLAAATQDPHANLHLFSALSLEATPADSSTQDESTEVPTFASRALPTVIADNDVPSVYRAEAAILLADTGHLDAEVAIHQCALIWAEEPVPAAALLIAASRAGIPPELRERLQFLPRSVMKLALSRAESIVDRWKRGRPSDSDIQRISRILRGAAPRL